MLLIYKNWISDVTKTWFTEDITKFGSACMAYPGDVHVNRWKIGWFMYLWKQNMPHESDYPKIGVKIWHFIIKDGKSLNKICPNSFIIFGSSKWHNSALIFPWSLLSQLFVPSQQFPSLDLVTPGKVPQFILMLLGRHSCITSIRTV